MKTQYIIYAIVILLFAKCTKPANMKITNLTDSKVEEICLNEIIDSKWCNESEIINDVKIITLETKDESLVHEPITKVIYTGSRIFIWDGLGYGGLICFDNNGKFVRRVKIGQGPDEVINICDVSFDETNRQLIVLDNPKVQFYNENLDYIKTDILPYGVDALTPTADGYILVRGYGYNRDLNDNDKYAIELTDKSYRTTSFMLKNQTNYPIIASVVPINEQSFSFSIPGSDTIFNYTDSILKPQYALLYDNKKKLDITIPKNEPGISYKCGYLETSKNQIIRLHDSQATYTAFRNKKNGRMRGGKNFIWDRNELIGIYTAGTTYGDTIITLDWPFSYVKGSLKKDTYISSSDILKLDKLDKEDNPFLILYTIKDF